MVLQEDHKQTVQATALVPVSAVPLNTGDPFSSQSQQPSVEISRNVSLHKGHFRLLATPHLVAVSSMALLEACVQRSLLCSDSTDSGLG